MNMTVNQIRQAFLKYFQQQQHTLVSSSSLVPIHDKTLLFTNAGMNQFKDIFLGLATCNYVRATSAQKCVRAGGKHNDLDNVGYTARHHTFFEMLGNFSFGDYFKEEALHFAWEFLTKILHIPHDKLYVTVYHTDNEAYDIWLNKIGLPATKIIKIGDNADGSSDNFWQMGDTGPCGPCSEIFYDHGASVQGGLPGELDADGDRYIEIWNCVFMQFNRDVDGNLTPLPKPSVDTGMGLERISAVMQQVHDNYEIDLFVNLIKHIAKITNCSDLHNVSLKVIADHIRAIAFLIADGVIPSNEGRGYVLRRIIRRAIRHGYILGQKTPFLSQIIQPLIIEMGDAYPELKQHITKIEQTILTEEQNFLQTITAGLNLLNLEIQKLQQHKTNKLSGDVAFKLYDTYGFPLDLTMDICREHKIVVDQQYYEQLMNKQKQMARDSNTFKVNQAILNYDKADTVFTGYSNSSMTVSIVSIYSNNQAVSQLNQDETGIIVLDQTVCYAESGGQIGDSGIIQHLSATDIVFNVLDTQNIRSQVIGHVGKMLHGSLKVGDKVTVTYDLNKRLAIARNHSATHLLHKALHQVLGNHAIQQGSLVSDKVTRFDFAHNKPVTMSELNQIETIVNHAIMMNYPVMVKQMPYDTAIKSGAMALFGEKYTSDVRVLIMGKFSLELCGGTHISRTGDIGSFKITSENGVANGIRRIEAVTGTHTIEYVQKNSQILDNLKEYFKAQTSEIIITKATALMENNRNLQKNIDTLHLEIAELQAQQYINQAVTVGAGYKLLILELSNLDNKILLNLTNILKQKLGRSIVIISCRNHERINFVVGVSKDISSKYKSGVIVNHLAGLTNGKGGGKADLATGSGTAIDQLGDVLATIPKYLETL